MKITPQAIYTLYRKAIRNPKYRNWIIIGTIAYILSPLDISPDFFPLAGQIDDLILLSMMAMEVSQMIFNQDTNKQDKEEENIGKTVDVEAIPLE